MERLLTDEEILKTAREKVCPIVDTMGIKIVRACCDAERKATLKAVGEWMEIYGAELELRVEDSLFLLGLIERIKRGEMPEEGK